MPTRNVDLTQHYDRFISEGVEAGRYSNASDAIGAGLRLLEQQEREDEARVQWLRAATQEAFDALDRGEGIQLSSADDIDAFVREIVEEARAAPVTTHA